MENVIFKNVETINGVKNFTGKEIIQEVKRILEDLYYKPQEDGTFSIEIYVDYTDKLSDGQIQEIVQSDNPMDTFYDVLFPYANDMIFNEEQYLYSQLMEHWNSDIFGDYDLYEDFIEHEWAVNNIYFNFPYDHFLDTEINVNLMIDTGDGDYDYTLNNFLSYNAHEEEYREIEEESSILWLVKQQGYTKQDLINAIENDIDNKFLDSVIQELCNVTTHMNALSFFVRMPLSDFIEFKEEESSITVKRDTHAGLIDVWSGAGSTLDIQLEKDLVIPKNVLHAHVDGSQGYGLSEIYGLGWDFWKQTYKIN